jgi:NADH dehydrogenase [ubiquinone] 1 alpha subcomplex assembly factor 1
MDRCPPANLTSVSASSTHRPRVCQSARPAPVAAAPGAAARPASALRLPPNDRLVQSCMAAAGREASTRQGSLSGQFRTLARLAMLTRKRTGPLRTVGWTCEGIGSTPFECARLAGAPRRHPPPHGTPPYPPVDNAVMPRELFRFDTAASVADFSAIDDRVMGGRSASRLRHDPAGHAIFEGEVSLADGGGFASVRSRSLPLGDAQAVTCRIEVLGDGKRYKLGLRTDDHFDGVNYQATFEPVSGEWTVLRLPLASFRPTWRGRPGSDATHVPWTVPDRHNGSGRAVSWNVGSISSGHSRLWFDWQQRVAERPLSEGRYAANCCRAAAIPASARSGQPDKHFAGVVGSRPALALTLARLYPF